MIRLRTAAWVAIGAGALAAAFLLGVEHARAAGVPTQDPLYYTGYLEDTGTPLNGPHLIQVNLWTDRTSTDTANRVCTTVPVGSTQVTDGRFRLPLDPGCVASVHANPDLYVEVVVDGAPLPRSKVGAVPYALEADTASHAAGDLLTRLNAAASATMTNPNTGAAITLDGVYCGSTSPRDGAVGGLAVAKSLCEKACGTKTAHMCTAGEIIRSAALNLPTPTNEQWVVGESGVINAQALIDNCAGYQTNSGSNHQGFTVVGPGAFYSRWCNSSHPLACCN